MSTVDRSRSPDALPKADTEATPRQNVADTLAQRLVSDPSFASRAAQMAESDPLIQDAMVRAFESASPEVQERIRGSLAGSPGALRNRLSPQPKAEGAEARDQLVQDDSTPQAPETSTRPLADLSISERFAQRRQLRDATSGDNATTAAALEVLSSLPPSDRAQVLRETIEESGRTPASWLLRFEGKVDDDGVSEQEAQQFGELARVMRDALGEDFPPTVTTALRHRTVTNRGGSRTVAEPLRLQLLQAATPAQRQQIFDEFGGAKEVSDTFGRGARAGFADVVAEMGPQTTAGLLRELRRDSAFSQRILSRMSAGELQTLFEQPGTSMSEMFERVGSSQRGEAFQAVWEKSPASVRAQMLRMVTENRRDFSRDDSEIVATLESNPQALRAARAADPDADWSELVRLARNDDRAKGVQFAETVARALPPSEAARFIAQLNQASGKTSTGRTEVAAALLAVPDDAEKSRDQVIEAMGQLPDGLRMDRGDIARLVSRVDGDGPSTATRELLNSELDDLRTTDDFVSRLEELSGSTASDASSRMALGILRRANPEQQFEILGRLGGATGDDITPEQYRAGYERLKGSVRSYYRSSIPESIPTPDAVATLQAQGIPVSSNRDPYGLLNRDAREVALQTRTLERQVRRTPGTTRNAEELHEQAESFAALYAPYQTPTAEGAARPIEAYRELAAHAATQKSDAEAQLASIDAKAPDADAQRATLRSLIHRYDEVQSSAQAHIDAFDGLERVRSQLSPKLEQVAREETREIRNNEAARAGLEHDFTLSVSDGIRELAAPGTELPARIEQSQQLLTRIDQQLDAMSHRLEQARELINQPLAEDATPAQRRAHAEALATLSDFTLTSNAGEVPLGSLSQRIESLRDMRAAAVTVDTALKATAHPERTDNALLGDLRTELERIDQQLPAAVGARRADLLELQTSIRASVENIEARWNPAFEGLSELGRSFGVDLPASGGHAEIDSALSALEQKVGLPRPEAAEGADATAQIQQRMLQLVAARRQGATAMTLWLAGDENYTDAQLVERGIIHQTTDTLTQEQLAAAGIPDAQPGALNPAQRRAALASLVRTDPEGLNNALGELYGAWLVDPERRDAATDLAELARAASQGHVEIQKGSRTQSILALRREFMAEREVLDQQDLSTLSYHARNGGVTLDSIAQNTRYPRSARIAAQKLARYPEAAATVQNADGTLNTDKLDALRQRIGRYDYPEPDRRLVTEGHLQVLSNTLDKVRGAGGPPLTREVLTELLSTSPEAAEGVLGTKVDPTELRVLQYFAGQPELRNALLGPDGRIGTSDIEDVRSRMDDFQADIPSMDRTLRVQNFFDPAQLDQAVEDLHTAFSERNLLIFGGTDDAAVWRTLVNRPHHHREAIITEYEARYGTGLRDALRSEQEGWELGKSMHLLERYNRPQEWAQHLREGPATGFNGTWGEGDEQIDLSSAEGRLQWQQRYYNIYEDGPYNLKEHDDEDGVARFHELKRTADSRMAEYQAAVASGDTTRITSAERAFTEAAGELIAQNQLLGAQYSEQLVNHIDNLETALAVCEGVRNGCIITVAVLGAIPSGGTSLGVVGTLGAIGKGIVVGGAYGTGLGLATRVAEQGTNAAIGRGWDWGDFGQGVFNDAKLAFTVSTATATAAGGYGYLQGASWFTGGLAQGVAAGSAIGVTSSTAMRTTNAIFTQAEELATGREIEVPVDMQFTWKNVGIDAISGGVTGGLARYFSHISGARGFGIDMTQNAVDEVGRNLAHGRAWDDNLMEAMMMGAPAQVVMGARARELARTTNADRPPPGAARLAADGTEAPAVRAGEDGAASARRNDAPEPDTDLREYTMGLPDWLKRKRGTTKGQSAAQRLETTQDPARRQELAREIVDDHFDGQKRFGLIAHEPAFRQGLADAIADGQLSPQALTDFDGDPRHAGFEQRWRETYGGADPSDSMMIEMGDAMRMTHFGEARIDGKKGVRSEVQRVQAEVDGRIVEDIYFKSFEGNQGAPRTEIVASLVNDMFGLDSIPRTRLGRRHGKYGSAQEGVPPEFSQIMFAADEVANPRGPYVDSLSELQAIDYLMNAGDRHTSNLFYAPPQRGPDGVMRGRVMAIDSEGAMASLTPGIIPGWAYLSGGHLPKTYTQRFVNQVRVLTQGGPTQTRARVETHLGIYASPAEVDAFMARLNVMKADIETKYPGALHPGTPVTGRQPVLPRPNADDFLRPGTEVTLGSGEGAQPGWAVASREGDRVTLTGPRGETRVVDAGELVQSNPQLLQADQWVTVRRSGGQEEEGVILGPSARQEGAFDILMPSGNVRPTLPNAMVGLFTGGAAPVPATSPIIRGRSVRVARSNGGIEEGWTITGFTENGLIGVAAPGFSKSVTPWKLLENNPELLPQGMAVRVRRSDGTFETASVMGQSDRPGHINLLLEDGRPRRTPYLELVDANRQIFTGRDVQPGRLVHMSANSPAGAQSNTFLNQHRINGDTRIEDGFTDGGRYMEMDRRGKVLSDRELIVVDRTRDDNLRTRSAAVRRSMGGMSTVDKAQALANYVDDAYGSTNNIKNVNQQLVVDRAGFEVLLGDVPAGAPCRHRALMYKVLADEIGLNATLVRGRMDGAAHEWVQVRLDDGRTAIIDVMREPPGQLITDFSPYTDHGGNPIQP